MPTFFVDGGSLEFEPGEMVLHAMLRQDKFAPYYCYHEGLKVVAQCRMCLVDIPDMGNGRGAPKLQTACSTPCAENMKVDTLSPKVKEGQNLINEYLLTNHPLDCPICDQAGECDLQDYAFQFGTGHSEMAYEKRTYGWRNVGTFIALERNRCVHCSRCERYSKDIVGSHDFGMFLRGHELTFDTYEDEHIAHKFQGNLADLCPVGAITGRHWRFKRRAWKFNKAPSVCASCSTGCNVTLEHHQNRLFRLKPRDNMAVNRWWMCDEGRVNFEHLNDRKTRWQEPQARVGGRSVPAAWDAVYDAIGARLKELGATGGQVVGLADTHATNEELFVLKTLLAEAFGGATTYFPYRPGAQQEQPPRTDTDPFIFSLITTDKTPNTEGARRLGLTGDENDQRLKTALQAGPKVVVLLGDPLADDEALRAQVAKAELVLRIGTHFSPWDEVADVVLPGYTYAEKYGTYTNKAGRVQRIQPALIPPEGARDPLAILTDLGLRAGWSKRYAGAAEVLEALGQTDGAFHGLSWDILTEQGQTLAAESARASA